MKTLLKFTIGLFHLICTLFVPQIIKALINKGKLLFVSESNLRKTNKY